MIIRLLKAIISINSIIEMYGIYMDYKCFKRPHTEMVYFSARNIKITQIFTPILVCNIDFPDNSEVTRCLKKI